MEKIRLGVSACLLGQEVRYDGGHKLNHFIRDELGRYVDFVPVCPEVECGMSIPRESLRLTGDPETPRLVTGKTGVDHTDQMNAWAEKRVRELAAEDLCGYIFKKDSPSSGLFRVRVYNDSGNPVKTGVGLFARMFTRHFPLLPVEEEGRLSDPRLRENFIESIFVFKRFRDMLAQEKSRKALVDFHTRHKLLILAHSPNHYREMGRLVASLPRSIDDACDRYVRLLSDALNLKTTEKKNTNVLQHILGYFKMQLTSDEKQEVLELIGHYRDGHLPLIVPVTLLNHFVRKYDQPYLKGQYYLNPHPLELQLRNHA